MGLGRPYLRGRAFRLPSRQFCRYSYIQMKFEPKGQDASRLRQRKFAAIRSLQVPEDGLPGSLSLTHRSCGKPTCRCAKGVGHPIWSLTYMLDGKKRVERIPDAWVEEVKQRVEAGKKFRDAVAEVFTANAQLMVLWRRQHKE